MKYHLYYSIVYCYILFDVEGLYSVEYALKNHIFPTHICTYINRLDSDWALAHLGC